MPPGGFWDPALEGVLSALGTPILLGEAASPGPGCVVTLSAEFPVTWLVFGSAGRLEARGRTVGLPGVMTGIETGDLLSEVGGRWSVAAFFSGAPALLSGLVKPETIQNNSIRVLAVPEFEGLFDDAEWTISPQSSRIGLRLLGPAPNLGVLAASRPSAPGVIQAPGQGELLVHGPTGPTSGGYPAVGSVIRADLSKLAELPAGTQVRLVKVPRNEAMLAWNLAVEQHEARAASLRKLKRLGLV